jgi:hypothetical protein
MNSTHLNSTVASRVEAGQNTSTVALRIVRGDKKGTQCPGDINTGAVAIQIAGVSKQTVKYGREFCGISAQE